MAKKTSAHIRPCNVGSVEEHNERGKEYVERLKSAGKEIYFFPELSYRNTSWQNPDYHGKTCAEIFEDMKNLYKEKKGQAPQLKERIKRNPKTGREKKIAGWSPLREMVVVIKEDTKISDFDYFKQWTENQGLKVVRIDLHKDEGHRDENGKIVENFHAHVVLDYLDWDTASTVKLKYEKMSELQSVLAISLDMERGEKKEDTGAKYMDHNLFRDMMREIDAMSERLKDLKAEEKKAETRVKGLTKMVNNLEAKKEKLEEDLHWIDINEAYMEDLEEKIERLQGNENTLNKELSEKEDAKKEKDREIESLKNELKEVQLKLKEKKSLLTTAEQQLQDVTSKRTEVQRKYDELNPKYKKLQQQFETAVKEKEKQFNEAVKKQDKLLKERLEAIEALDEDGVIEIHRIKCETLENFIYEWWPNSREAVAAICERSSVSARHFTPEQAWAVENAMTTALDMEAREMCAEDLITLASNNLDMRTRNWFEKAEKEVMQIAQGTHRFSAALANARAAGAGEGGGASYITDLTDWAGNKMSR